MISKRVFCLRIFILVICVCMMTSCVLSPKPFRPVTYHDLGTPEIINKQGPFVKFTRFVMNGPYKNKMVFRSTNNKLIIDEYNKWAQTPETMLGRYMALAFRGKSEAGNAKTYLVDITVMSFEALVESGNALLIVEYTIVEPFQGKKRSFSRTFTAKMEKVNPENLAIAMSKIAENFAYLLKEDMIGTE